MVTTARDPSVKLKIFAKEMKLILPNSKRINRGNLEINGLIAECRKNNFTDLIILTENRGKPDGMRGITLSLNLNPCCTTEQFSTLFSSLSFTIWSNSIFQFVTSGPSS